MGIVESETDTGLMQVSAASENTKYVSCVFCGVLSHHTRTYEVK